MGARTLSGRQFALKCGVSHTTVQGWINAGQLETEPDGSIPTVKGLRQVKALRRKLIEAAAEPDDMKIALQRAELAEQQAKTTLREMEVAKASGRLLDAAEVEADARAACETIRNRLLTVGPRVALTLEALCAREGGAARAAAIQAVIDDEINAALTALHGARFAPPQETP